MEDEGRSVEEILRDRMDISGRMIQRLTRSRGVTHNRRPAFLSRRVKPGDLVSARIVRPEEPTLDPVRMDLDILYEDADLLVLDKPPGLLVHPTDSRQDRTLAHGVAGYLRDRGIEAVVRPVHRLDRDVSGAVLFAKSGFAHQQLDRQLREGGLSREYVGVVRGLPQQDEGTVEAPIGREPGHPTRRAVRPDGDPARTFYTVLERFPNAALLGIRLDTGRTHQIRVHLRHLGHPLLGDRLYGDRASRATWPALHASRLSFLQPRSRERIEVEAPIPGRLREVAEHLR